MFAAATIVCTGAASGATLAQPQAQPASRSFGNHLFDPTANSGRSGISWTSVVRVMDGGTLGEVRRHERRDDMMSTGRPSGMNNTCGMEDATSM